MSTIATQQLRHFVESEDARLVFSPLKGEPSCHGFAIEVKGPEGWRRISAEGNPLVRGGNLAIWPSRLEALPGGGLSLSGSREWTDAEGHPHRFDYCGQVRANDGGWLTIDLEIDSPVPILLPMKGGFEPELTIDMGPLPPYERGDHVWFNVVVQNPTRWNGEAHGNDFPATYQYDPYGHYELMAYYDLTAMSWMSFSNIARFMNYRFGFRRRYRPEPMYEVGMYADGFSGNTFPSGKQRFRYHLRARDRRDSPTENQALTALVEACLPMLPADTPWPEGATNWDDFAQNCAADLMNTEHCWGANDRIPDFILNYVDGRSAVWTEALEARGTPISRERRPCIDSAAWMAHPLAALRRIHSVPMYDTLQERLLDFIVPFVAGGDAFRRHGGTNGPGSGMWQYTYILEELWQVARLEGIPELERAVEEQVESVLVPFARNVGWVFPLCFNRATLRKVKNGDNHSVGGLYANFMLDLHERTGRQEFLEEAESALRVLLNLPMDTIPQEAFLNAIGTQALHRILERRPDPEMEEGYRYLLAQTLRMLHWFEDRTTPATREVSVLGMFQACSPILYPAFFENIEIVARLAPALRGRDVPQPILNVYHLARKTNYYFFQRCLPSNRRTAPLDFIPHEDIPILEGPKPFTVGQEIYGAGWTFRACLLWDAFLRAEQRDVMVLNLDSFQEPQLLAGSKSSLSLLLYNPLAREVTTALVIPETLSPRWTPTSLERRGGGGMIVLESPGRTEPLTLAAGERLLIDARFGQP